MDMLSNKGVQWDLAVTQTFSRVIAKKPLSQYNEVKKQIIKHYDKLGCIYLLFPEFRLTTLEIHFHGVLKIIDKVKYQQNLFYLGQMGFSKIKFMDKPEKWFEYCMKDYVTNQKTLGFNNIELDNINQYEDWIRSNINLTLPNDIPPSLESEED